MGLCKTCTPWKSDNLGKSDEVALALFCTGDYNGWRPPEAYPRSARTGDSSTVARLLPKGKLCFSREVAAEGERENDL